MSEIIGNSDVQERLWHAAAQNRLAHAYLFAGPEEVGKKTTALAFARRVLCEKYEHCGACDSCTQWKKSKETTITHPDFLLITPAGEGLRRNIGIEQARTARHFLELTPQTGSRKMLIIDDAERLTHEATNALLKKLEEPSSRMVMVLVSAEPWALLPTIRSRCVAVRFSFVVGKELLLWLQSMGARVAEAQELARLAGGRPGRAQKFLKDPKARKDAEQALRAFYDATGESDFQRHVLFAPFTKNREAMARSRIFWLEEAHRGLGHLSAHALSLVAALLRVDPYAPQDPVLALLSQSKP